MTSFKTKSILMKVKIFKFCVCLSYFNYLLREICVKHFFNSSLQNLFSNLHILLTLITLKRYIQEQKSISANKVAFVWLRFAQQFCSKKQQDNSNQSIEPLKWSNKLQFKPLISIKIPLAEKSKRSRCTAPTIVLLSKNVISRSTQI